MRDNHTGPYPSGCPHVSRWLDAERRGEEATAEAAFAEVFAALPRPLVPAGFADRVMTRLAGEIERAPWPLERAALWLLAVCAAALLLVPRWLPGLLDRLAPEALISGLA